MYGINWNAFVQDKTPGALRKPKLLAWFNALLTPVKALHTEFGLWRLAQERHIAISPQMRILIYWLNELFDSSERRFVIRNYTNVTPVLIWGEAYNNPLYLPTYLSSKSYDFEVVAHCDTYADRFRIKAFLDAYKLAGKKYKLKFEDTGGGLCSVVGLPDLEDF